MSADGAGRGGCPRCGAGLSRARDAAPWCPACEWGLDRYEPDRRRPEVGWRWLDRRLFRTAYRLTTDQYAALSGRPVRRRRWGAARICLLAAAVALIAVVLGLLGLGAYLIGNRFPSPRIVPGLLCVLLALALWPKRGRLDERSGRLDRSHAPTLFRLIDQVAAAVEAPAPHTVRVEPGFNATAGAAGLRRRRSLTLGVALWVVLPPQQRVALLAHELGHFVNGDARRGPLTHTPLTTLGALADLLRPDPPPDGAGRIARWLRGPAGRAVLGALRAPVLCGHLLLVRVCLRDVQRAEYLADELAARAAGSAAAAGLADTLVLRDMLYPLVRRAARHPDPGGGPLPGGGLLPAADRARTDRSAGLRGMRQLSVRDEVSMSATHPPTGLRAQMIESRPYRPATVTLTGTDSARIDEELAPVYRSAARTLAPR